MATSRIGSVLAAALMLAAGCTGGSQDASPAAVTTTEDVPVPSSEAPPQPSVATTTTTALTPSSDSESASQIPILEDELIVDSQWPFAATVWDRSSARKYGQLAGAAGTAVEGPLSIVVEVPLRGWVYQRVQDSNVIYFDDGSGERELLVGDSDQRLLLEGVTLADDEDVEVMYQRFTDNDFDAATTLRAYSMDTRTVREITVTGGFESASNFSTITGRFAVARFYGEGHYELSVIDLETGERPYRSADYFNCFDGEDPACPEYNQALAIGTDIYGFGPSRGEASVTRMSLYRFDTTTSTEELIASYPWEPESYYAIDMIESAGHIVVSLSNDQFYGGFGDALPPLIYNLTTGKSSLGPEPGFVQLSWLT